MLDWETWHKSKEFLKNKGYTVLLEDGYREFTKQPICSFDSTSSLYSAAFPSCSIWDLFAFCSCLLPMECHKLSSMMLKLDRTSRLVQEPAGTWYGLRSKGKNWLTHELIRTDWTGFYIFNIFNIFLIETGLIIKLKTDDLIGSTIDLVPKTMIELNLNFFTTLFNLKVKLVLQCHPYPAPDIHNPRNAKPYILFTFTFHLSFNLINHCKNQ